jgi:hypothetical protein
MIITESEFLFLFLPLSGQTMKEEQIGLLRRKDKKTLEETVRKLIWC